jgi:hypothetical protein
MKSNNSNIEPRPDFELNRDNAAKITGEVNKMSTEIQSLYTINEVALLLKVHQQTLRNWERKKVIIPKRVGKRRIYTCDDLEMCRRIKEYAGKGIPLKGVRELIRRIG